LGDGIQFDGGWELKDKNRFLVVIRHPKSTDVYEKDFSYSKYCSAETKEGAIASIDADSDEGDEYVLIDTSIQGAAAVLGFYRIELKAVWFERG